MYVAFHYTFRRWKLRENMCCSGWSCVATADHVFMQIYYYESSKVSSCNLYCHLYRMPIQCTRSVRLPIPDANLKAGELYPGGTNMPFLGYYNQWIVYYVCSLRGRMEAYQLRNLPYSYKWTCSMIRHFARFPQYPSFDRFYVVVIATSQSRQIGGMFTAVLSGQPRPVYHLQFSRLFRLHMIHGCYNGTPPLAPIIAINLLIYIWCWHINIANDYI